jgi:hypothetical protein
MRKLLKQQEGRRGEFRGTVAQFGTKRAFRGSDLPTMMLSDVKDETGQIVTDHLWMTVGKQLSRLNVQVGEEVVFVARVTRYEKGYKGTRQDVIAAPPSTDYRLSYLTKVRRVETRQPAPELRAV